MMDCSAFVLRWGLSTATRRTAAAAVRTAGAAVRTAGTAAAAAHGTAPAASPGTATAASPGTAATATPGPAGTATERRQLTSKWQGPLCPSVQAKEEKDIERKGGPLFF
jgi:hypothetical protein